MLERLRVAVRPRSPWEAADLGLALLRAQAGPVYRVWLTALLPLTLVLAVACRHSPWLAPLIIWWLKPVLDRPVLHVLAKATFGETPDLAATFRAGPSYCRKGVAATLLWRRFSLERSLLLPVWQLEEPSPGDFRKRRRVLFQRGRPQARLLTWACLLFTLVLAVGVLAGLAFFRPGSEAPSLLAAVFARQNHRLAWLDLLLTVLPTLAMAVVEPVYVAAGFGLYLNRRVQLEGWDLEQAFRQLGQRARGRAAQALLLIGLLAFGGLGLRAQDSPPPPLSEPKTELAEVMKAPEFATRRQAWRLRLRHPSMPDAAMPAPAWIGQALNLLALIVKWLIPAGVILWLLLALWRHRHGLALALKPPAPVAPPPARILGLDIRPEALPADIPEAALRLWDQGDPRGALALLYRGALADLVHGLGIPLTASATEGECLRLGAPGLPGPGAAYFARLTGAWQKVAYGGQAAPSEDRELCAAWAGHFRAPRREVRP
jgi:hypothetical protein